MRSPTSRCVPSPNTHCTPTPCRHTPAPAFSPDPAQPLGSPPIRPGGLPRPPTPPPHPPRSVRVPSPWTHGSVQGWCCPVGKRPSDGTGSALRAAGPALRAGGSPKEACSRGYKPPEGQARGFGGRRDWTENHGHHLLAQPRSATRGPASETLRLQHDRGGASGR